MVMGTILDYLFLPGVPSTPRKTALLFFGVLLGFAAILTLAYADAYRERMSHAKSVEKSSTESSNPLHSSSDSGDGVDAITSRELVDMSTLQGGIPPKHRPSKVWIYVTLFAGLIASTWSPLSNLGTTYMSLLLFKFVLTFKCRNGWTRRC
jgi:hypothetical protein